MAMRGFLRLAPLLQLLSALACAGSQHQPWLTVELNDEFTAEKTEDVRSFDDYLLLEEKLFDSLQSKVYALVETGPGNELVRYSAGSAADPQDDQPNWNRSFEMPSESAVGGVLLLHGMSDSPYSLRALAEFLGAQGYWVVGLRLPGHGTAPSGLKHVAASDMVAAVQLGMQHIASALGEKPIHIVGYSTGAALALSFALDALEGSVSPAPASLVMISPAIRIHPTAALARFKAALSLIPGLGGLGWLQILPEFDPYKYNSFATNAGDVVHRLTRFNDRRIGALAQASSAERLPPILVFKSTVDATVTTEATIDNLLALLPPNRNELVLFDINRLAAKSSLLASDPGPMTVRLMSDESLPFSLTLVTNEHSDTSAVVAHSKAPFSGAYEEAPLNLPWPVGVLSLSHVALPIPPDDPLYGEGPPEDGRAVFLGATAIRGERGLLYLPADWQLRMRYNPFYEVIARRVLEWFTSTEAAP